MVQQEHESLLNDTSRTQGKAALRSNVAAAAALADAVKSTLGPRGLDKMLLSEDGQSTVTSDGVTVLQQARVEHPIAQLLITHASTQERVAGDGTTSTVLLTSELLHNASEIVEMGVHPTLVEEGFRAAEKEAQSFLSSISRSSSQEMQKKCVRTSLSRSGVGELSDHLSDLALSAAEMLTVAGADGPHADVGLVKKVEEIGRPATTSELVRGLMLPKQRLHREMELHSEGGSILILDGGISRRKPEMDITLRVSDPEMLAELHRQEVKDISERVKAIAASGADLLCVRDGIDEEAGALLLEAGITAYRRIEKADLELLSRATGATIVSDPLLTREDDLGSFTSLSERKWAGVNQMSITGEGEAAVTLIIRGTTKQRVDEVSCAFDDASEVACGLVSDSSVLPGGGASHIATSRHLRAFATSVSGRRQLAVQAFAAALEVIPRTLSQNAGLSPIDEVLRINAAQAEGGAWVGLDLMTGEVSDMAEAGVVEPAVVTKNSLSSALEATVAVLRIEDFLWADSGPSIPEWEKADGTAGER